VTDEFEANLRLYLADLLKNMRELGLTEEQIHRAMEPSYAFNESVKTYPLVPLKDTQTDQDLNQND
jgi:hypothetical protein